MLAQSTNTQPEATPKAALKAKSNAIASSPSASAGSGSWKSIAKRLKGLHEAISDGLQKVEDDQGVVGTAYRLTKVAAASGSGPADRLAAHIAIEGIAKSFVTDGTYGRYAVCPGGIAQIAGLVGELQQDARQACELAGRALEEVFFSSSRRRAAQTAEFAQAFSAWERAAIENAALDVASADAGEALESAYSVPEALWPQRPRGPTYCSEEAIQKATMPFDRKVDLMNILRQWRAAQAASAEKAAAERAEASSSAAYEQAWSTFRALMSARPASTAQLLQKMEVLLKETVLERSVLSMVEPLAADDIAELISSEPNDTDSYEKRMLLEFYFDLCRINGTPSPLERVAPFDPAAWTETFEALPGHQIDERGAVFHEPEAWGPDYLTDEDFRVTDPAEIEAYWLAVENYCPESVAERAAQFPDYRVRPFIAGSLRSYEFIYGEGDPRLAEKAALFERRHEQDKLPPLGRHLWTDLAPWQQKLVREFAKERAQQASAPQLLAAE